jgi:hypothetical protein
LSFGREREKHYRSRSKATSKICLPQSAICQSGFAATEKAGQHLFQSLPMLLTASSPAGQIDFVAKTYAATQYGEVHNQFVQAQTDASIALHQLQLYTGIADSIATVPFSKSSSPLSIASITTDSATLVSTPLIQYYHANAISRQKIIAIRKEQSIAWFLIRLHESGFEEYRNPFALRAGINIPIWFWQYSAAIKAAKTNLQITQQNTLAQQQNLSSKLQQSKSDAVKFHTSLAYYERHRA